MSIFSKSLTNYLQPPNPVKFSFIIASHSLILLLESVFTGENTNLIAKLSLASFQHTCKVLIIMGITLVPNACSKEKLSF